MASKRQVISSASKRLSSAGQSSNPGSPARGFGVDGEPGGAVGGEDVLVLQVPVQESVAGFVDDFAYGGGAVGDGSAGLWVGDAGEGLGGLVQHGSCDVAEVAYAGGGGLRGQVGEEVCDDEDGVAGAGQGGEHAGGVEAFQEHGVGGRVVVEEADRAVAVPQAQGEGLSGALLVEELEFEDGRGAVLQDGQDERGDPVHG